MTAPKLPELPECDTRDLYTGEGAFTAAQMNAHYLKGYEEARAEAGNKALRIAVHMREVLP